MIHSPWRDQGLFSLSWNADNLADLQIQWIDPGVCCNNSLHSGAESLCKSKDGIAGADGVQGSPGAHRRSWCRNADNLANLQPQWVDSRVSCDDSLDGGAKPLRQGKDGIARADGV